MRFANDSTSGMRSSVLQALTPVMSCHMWLD